MKMRKMPSIKEIRRMNPIKAKYDPFAYIPDSLAPYFIKLFLYTPITANQISLALYLLIILAVSLIALNQHIILAIVILHIVLLLDCVDGAIARAKKHASLLGMYFECTFHETVPPFVFFAVASYLYRTLNQPAYLYFGGLIVISQLIINSFGTSKQRIMYLRIRKLGKVPSDLIDGSSLLKETKNAFSLKLLRIANVLPNLAFSTYIITFGYIFGFLKYVLLFYFTYFLFAAFFKIIIELIIGFKPYGLR